MANTLLSPTIITKEALRILHANLNFIGNCNRQYDNQFANEGASPSGKIGPTLTIRKPNRFTVRSGATIAVQDVTEASTTLTVATQKGVDVNFTAQDLTLTIDEFSQRYLKPAIARLATEMESDALSMVLDVSNAITLAGSTASFNDMVDVKRRLDENLAPDTDRCFTLTPSHEAGFVKDIKGFFNPQAAVGSNFRKGLVGSMVQGFDLYSNTVLTPTTSGSCANTTGYTVNGNVTSGSATVTLQAGANTFKKGDIVTFASSNAVHYETKADLGYLKQYTITADFAGGAGTITISPTPVSSGANQNCTATPQNNDAVVKVGPGASGTYKQSVAFHHDAFAFVTADLIDVSKFGAWGARLVQDGISMRIARQYDIVNDKIPTRIDVLYGFKTIREELACRLVG